MTPERSLEAKKKAMRLLERMDRSEADLRQKLSDAGFTPEEVEAALGYVKSYGYIDDGRFAQNYIRIHFSSKSRTKILGELAAKGVDRETALEAWDAVCEYEDHDEEALIRQAVRKRCPEGIPQDRREKQKLYAFLARRGFSFGDIERVLGQMDPME